MIKYKTFFEDTIEKVEIERESDSSVWRKDHVGKLRRHQKTTSYEIYFNTWQEAHNHLIHLAETKLSVAKQRVGYAKQLLAKTQAMKIS